MKPCKELLQKFKKCSKESKALQKLRLDKKASKIISNGRLDREVIELYMLHHRRILLAKKDKRCRYPQNIILTFQYSNRLVNYSNLRNKKARSTPILPLLKYVETSHEMAPYQYKNLNWEQTRLIFIPFLLTRNNQGTHYIMFVVNVMNSSVLILDSCRAETRSSFQNSFRYYIGGTEQNLSDNTKKSRNSLEHKYPITAIYKMIDHITDEYFRDGNGKARIPYWTITRVNNYPVQENNFDCGAYLCYFFHCLYHNWEISVSEIKPKEMMNFRKRIVFALQEEGFFRKRVIESESDDSDVISVGTVEKPAKK